MEMEIIMNRVYRDETIQFDGVHFIGCSFIGCRIIITSSHFDFDRCTFKESSFHVDPRLNIFEEAAYLVRAGHVSA
jgi:hypothetical protein